MFYFNYMFLIGLYVQNLIHVKHSGKYYGNRITSFWVKLSHRNPIKITNDKKLKNIFFSKKKMYLFFEFFVF
jgi:hypothetical protein